MKNTFKTMQSDWLKNREIVAISKKWKTVPF